MGLRVAVVQQGTRPGCPDDNRARALAFGRQALGQGAEVILFHEELLVGYVENLHELAEPVDGFTTRAFQEMLRGTDARVIYGLTERDGDEYYIAAPVVSADGIVANYRKTHLWWRDEGLRHEPRFYKPGDRLVTFEHRGCRCGLMICYDGDFPEMTRSYARLGCSLLFWLNNRGSRGHEEVKDLAARNSMLIASACCCGVDEAGRPCRGGSNITGPRGELLAEIWDDEGVIHADVSSEEVPALREANPWFRGMRPELYCY